MTDYLPLGFPDVEISRVVFFPPTCCDYAIFQLPQVQLSDFPSRFDMLLAIEMSSVDVSTTVFLNSPWCVYVACPDVPGRLPLKLPNFEFSQVFSPFSVSLPHHFSALMIQLPARPFRNGRPVAIEMLFDVVKDKHPPAVDNSLMQ